MFGLVVFALHPIQVESVTWISGMKDVLSSFLFLGAWLFYLMADDGRKKNFAISLVLFIAALFSKPSVVVLGPCLFLSDVFLKGTSFKSAWKKPTIYLLVGIPFICLMP